MAKRVPGTDHDPGSETGARANPVLAGKLLRSEGQPANLPGAWPQFRGPQRDAISAEAVSLERSWAPGQPRELWAIDVGEGYAGPVILNGRVYLMDYDRDQQQDALRCLSLADGREIWRYSYPVRVKRNHGMSRTVPVVTDQLVVAIGPKCHVVALNSITGELLWGLDLTRQFGATVPPWYAGQCPLLDQGAVILAPGGDDALLLAVEAQTGKVLWRTPNPHGWKMTHSSVMPMEFDGQRMYVYCASKGVVGVSAQDGSLLWETPDWKISIATVPSPLPLDGGRLFLTGGYNAGSLMLQLANDGGRLAPRTLFKLAPEVFGATQHTPIRYHDHLYGVRADGKFVCLTLDGKVAWASGSGQQFGLGSFILANGLILAMNDSGLLRLIEALPQKYTLLAQAQVLKGRESWAPLALAGGRLIVRDLTRMVCLEVGRP
ncbi:MAG: PQQ-like beta-propeller repeat protein [Verrucomicrobia bacterium]|nr:PQQ-like beta-propeller repeat protein [Verrucomicrobiota bacterium]HRY58744.1 PQQ-like beta-propeller repeat protein [Candidatus Paceibacterota bacterium]HNS70734.1 PQQ-like beta-propeller repeat protein [Verrucomicrobiota bacterium]HQE90329.1 PQQ-like beta-propeller repeat protein [Verrucomicrobiota bacterium]HQH03483.1 PQQ-like beta-propeller repeat protein [Verrucomicrobiota bacterium]